MIFWPQTVLITPDENSPIHLDQNKSVFLLTNIYNGNFSTAIMYEKLVHLCEYFQLKNYKEKIERNKEELRKKT